MRPWQYSLLYFKFSDELTYLIVQVFECKRQHLAIRDACDTEIEPCPVVVAFEERCRVGTDPEVIAVFVDASLCPCEIAAAELAAEYDLGVRNLPSRPLRVRLQQLLLVRTFEPDEIFDFGLKVLGRKRA